jgi:Na+-transporting NADH:ubiquinone oxidoreductase subunit C
MNFSRKKMREWVRTLGFMAVTSTVCVAAVAGAYQAAQGRIRINEETVLRRAVLAAAGIDDMPDEPAAVSERFTALAKPRDGGGYQVGDDIVVVSRASSGLWGPIQAMVGFDQKRQCLTGIAFLSHQETPGLGARIEEAWFLQQFRGLRLPAALATAGMPKAETQFDAITGATITSAAVRDIVNATEMK